MENKNLNYKQYNNLIFRCINLTELRDETIYTQLKMDTQREYLLLIFLHNLINTYLDYYWMGNLCDEEWKIIYLNKKNFNTKNELFFTEMAEFKIFIESEINIVRLERLKQIITCRIARDIAPLPMFYNVFNLYDEQFNSKIILEKFCGIKLTQEQFYSIILYFFDKTKYLELMLEPAYNARSLIIKNYYKDHEPFNVRWIKFSLKNSEGIEYIDETRDGKFTYNFDKKFRETILTENWSDGYNFWWKEPDENDDRKNKINCLKYFVEILGPYENQIISMTITKNPSVPNEQIHFYIKKNLITQIKSFINPHNTHYSNISLLMHSYATWIFNANIVYSNLHNSMSYIFQKNNINVEEEPDKNIMNSEFCIRGIREKIIITEEFKNLWFNKYDYRELINSNPLIRIHKLESKTGSDGSTTKCIQNLKQIKASNTELKKLINCLTNLKQIKASNAELEKLINCLTNLKQIEPSNNAELIANLLHKGIIKSINVAIAMNAVDRKNYAPRDFYQDSPQQIGYSATISAPHMHAAVLEYLLPSCSVLNAKILDVGCGSGYLCALFAKLNPSSKIIGIDYIKELVDLSKTNIEKADKTLLESGQVTLSYGDGWNGVPEKEPFDCIHVGAAAVDFPQNLLSQLKVNGLMVIPIGPDRRQQYLYLVKRHTNTGPFKEQFDVENVMDVRYVPLVKI